MTGADDECRALTRYLTGRAPDDYVRACYRRARDVDAAVDPPATPIDRSLWAAALAGRVPARLADAYARWLRPTGPLRRRLTLLLAILESSPAASGWIDTAETGPRGLVTLRLMGGLAVSGGLLALAMVAFGPIHLATAWVRPRPTA